MQSWGLSNYIETKLQTACFSLILSFFKKIERGLELVSLPHFLYFFDEEYFPCFILLIGLVAFTS